MITSKSNLNSMRNAALPFKMDFDRSVFVGKIDRLKPRSFHKTMQFLEQILMLMDVEMQMVDPSEDIVIVGAKM